ncbi:tRNA lysidine(34) synthetase TilS [Azospirillum halopraeferens]|uniref:tRNA lysidine(34) synthetase TilS n=1 Tax=Azospirillum halopraeferens TaxID=34010 RepID=UPI0003FAB9AC|nr:tRNA lysidine(34) synthetase TilS [Azospirillum halopraeferens]
MNAAAPTVSPLSDAGFADRLARIGGFEARPRLAVGVSGGADSLALTVLAQRWAAARGGAVLALTVDHGLRAGSAEEAVRVAGWMAAHGIAHATLRWQGGKPAAGIQDAARTARRRLLTERCRDEGILHLLLAHHRDDQAETVLLRLSRGSGIDGLAGMAPLRWEGPVRVVRPLLDVPRTSLEATCRAFGQPWIEDPSNRSAAYARGRLRAVAPLLSAEGLSADRLCDTARRAARARRALEEATAVLLADAAEVFPEGWLRLDTATLAAAPDEVGLRALSAAVACVGGAPYPPRAERLERLYAEIAGGLPAGRTLAGCIVLSHRGKTVIAREPRATAGAVPARPGEVVLWDDRFRVVLSPDAPPGLTVACSGTAGWRAARALRPEVERLALPGAVRVTLPALWDAEGVVAVPSVGVRRGPLNWTAHVAFTPRMPLGGPAFPVVKDGSGII